jgi:hypothetical protein
MSPTDEDARLLAAALRGNPGRSPGTFVNDVLPIIRDPTSLDWIVSQVPAAARWLVIRELHKQYGPQHEFSDDPSRWGMSAGAFTDLEAHQRRHEAKVAHTVRVAIPAIRAWLSAHPDELRDKRRPPEA